MPKPSDPLSDTAFPPSAQAKRTAAALDELAHIGSDIATLLHAVTRGAVLQLSPAGGRIVLRHKVGEGIASHDSHGPLPLVLRELAERVRR